MKFVMAVIMVGGIWIALVAAAVYGGWFNVAADEPHSRLMYSIMETVRWRSITTRARALQPPALDDPALIATGARHYAAMCSECHSAPDEKDSELRHGLYPKPPNLTQPIKATAGEVFWVIKHGIKMSGMPAWGATHDDQSIWSLVAFVQKLPGISATQYHALSGAGHAHSHDHHAGTDSHKPAGGGNAGASHHHDGTQPR
jgi:mono/diheme cytochrome c family protein